MWLIDKIVSGAKGLGNDIKDMVKGQYDFTKGLFSNPNEAWDKFKNGNTNEVNERVAQENLKYQRENLDYQKALQQQIFDREDTSYQRTMNDMYGAGMSPLAMQGTNGAGEAIATEPLHNDFQMQDKGIGQTLGELAQVGSMIGSLVGQFQNMKLGNKQVELLDEQIKAQKEENSYLSAVHGDRVASFGFDTQAKRFLSDKSRIDYFNAKDNRDLNLTYGLTDTMSTEERLFRTLASQIGFKPFNTFDSGLKDSNGKKMYDMSFRDLTKDDFNNIKNALSDMLSSGDGLSLGSLFGDKGDKSSLTDAIKKAIPKPKIEDIVPMIELPFGKKKSKHF